MEHQAIITAPVPHCEKRKQTMIIGHLESLLLIAQWKGLSLRRPWNVTWNADEAGKNIGANLLALDKLNVPWSIQNTILNYINNCDEQSVWDDMYQNSFARLARRALGLE